MARKTGRRRARAPSEETLTEGSPTPSSAEGVAPDDGTPEESEREPEPDQADESAARSSVLSELADRTAPALAKAAPIAVPLLLLAGAALFLRVVTKHIPFELWLLRRVASYLLASGLFAAACLSAGHVVVRRVLRAPLPLLEHVTTSFAVGVLVFFFGQALLGFAGLYGPVFFVGYPAALLAAGAIDVLRTGKRVVRGLRRARRISKGPAPSLVTWFAIGFGAVGLVLVYVPILVPDNVAFDARWYHLAIAQQYTVAGGVTRFPEGWFLGAIPHLASFLYAWAFMMPKADVYDCVVLAAHVEFTVFVFTLASIPVLVRSLVPGTRAHAAWPALFLFPGIFLYDSSLTLGADHVAALFAIPTFTLTLRFVQSFDPRPGVLLGLVASAAFLSKYTGALTILAFPILAIGVGLALRVVRDRLARRLDLAPLRACSILLGVVLVATSVHWAKNWVWYGDPLYPLLSERLSPRPWTADSAERFRHFVESEFWRPTRDWKGLVETGKALFGFSFEPHDWETFHGKTPVFGSLFTLLLAPLPFLRATRRLWTLYGATLLGVFVWFSTHHQDRYLQAIVPWMAGATAAVLLLVWRVGRPARIAAVALVGAQLAWATHVPFIPGHVMASGGSVYKQVLELASASYRKDPKLVEGAFGSMVAASRKLPPDAVVLFHDYKLAVGLRRRIVSDGPHSQGGISYGALGSSKAVHEHLATLGVTHVLWVKQASGLDSLAGDLVLHRYLSQYAGRPTAFGSQLVAPLAGDTPPDDADARVLVLSCGGSTPSGVYELRSLHFAPWQKRPAAKPLAPPPQAVPHDVDLAVVDRACHQQSLAGFQVATRRKKTRVDILVRGATGAPVVTDTKQPAEAHDVD